MKPETKPPVSQGETRNSIPEFSKTDIRFWRERLFKRTTDDWQVQIGFAGKQERFPLGTPNKDAAAAKARDIYLSLHAVGWEGARAKFKPWTNAEERVDSPSVGEFLEAVAAVAVVKATTLKQYERKFRRLVSGVMGITGGKERFDYVGEGAAQWRDKVNSVKLSALTPTRITEWRVEYLKTVAGNPVKHRHAQFTVGSLIRSSKSLFSETKVLPYLSHLTLPSPLPFDGIAVGKLPRNRYRSKIDTAELLAKARKDLRDEYPECWKILLLEFGAGLRRAEVDSLKWDQFQWSDESISIEVHEYGDVKTETSADEIKVDPALLAELKTYHKTRQSEFVIESTRAAKVVNWNRYRCEPHFKRLLAWLRANGVNERFAMHTLRKEFGNSISKQAGILAASTALRHANITLTRQFYVDGGRVALPMADMLGSGKPPKKKQRKSPAPRNIVPLKRKAAL
jgi:integrase